MRYQLVDYFDVWGNSKEGYEINDQRVINIVELPDNASDQDFLDTAIEEGIIKKGVNLSDIIIEEYGTTIEILDPNPKDYFIEEEEEEEENGKYPLPICGFWSID